MHPGQGKAARTWRARARDRAHARSRRRIDEETRTGGEVVSGSAPVPFLDLKAKYASIRAEIEPAVLRVLGSTNYALGPEVVAFEEEFAARPNLKYAVAVNTGTSALRVALLAAGIGPGDEVITVSMSFIATVSAIRYTGATPVFVDVDPVTCTMDATQI